MKTLTDARIPLKMMTIALGQGQGRERMELWFDRAMKLDPNNTDACNSKLWYLEPKWYGSVEDMLAFGRECVHNTKWGGRVPLILVDAHIAIRNEFIPDTERSAYWSRPEVWADLKSAHTRFFELYPDASGWYPNYAWYAYQAGDWSAFNEMVPKLGPANYDFFGGETNFNQMVAVAKAHAGESQVKN
jgi:hypothetical protein